MLEGRFIRWSATRPLLWSDFQGQPTTDDGAVTYAFLDRKLYKKNPRITYLKAIFGKEQSWVRIPDSLGLIHEQGHFDIVEMYARKFNNKFSVPYLDTKEDRVSLETKQFDELCKEMDEVQANYDGETQGYLNQQEQERWNKWIKKQLDSIPKIEFD
ncbi:MAG: hypothetical protein V4685_13300 [Bacteroidota bacterium]